MLDAAERRLIFDSPPEWLLEELAQDDIKDVWEPIDESLGETIDYQPRIGILTQPTSEQNKKLYGYDHYILMDNYNYIRWPGSIPVIIPYDTPAEELDMILPQINGVLFTGGGLVLTDATGLDQHKYYKTAKRIFNYSLFQKDVLGQEWPILGIC